MLNRSAVLVLCAIAAIGSAALAASSALALEVANHGAVSATSATGGAGAGRVILHKLGNSGPVSNQGNLGQIAGTAGNPGSGPHGQVSFLKHTIPIDCPPLKGCGDHDHDHDHDWDHDHHRPWTGWWHQLHYGVVEYNTVNVPVAMATGPAPCNCLTKRYLQDGSVLFKDLCTKEEAMATPEELKVQAQRISPQVQ